MVRIGWKWLAPFQFKDDLDREHYFTDTSPGLIYTMAVAAYTRKHQKALAKTMDVEALCNTEAARSVLVSPKSPLVVVATRYAAVLLGWCCVAE